MESTLVSGQAPALTTRRPPLFECELTDEPDGVVRVKLRGDIDLAVADPLRARLGEICRPQRQVRLDLSKVRFIDLSGLDALVSAIYGARLAGCVLEVDPDLSPSVAWIAAFAGARSILGTGPGGITASRASLSAR